MALNTTQDHIPIAEIKNDIILLKNGGAVLIFQVPAINFGLLSDREQMGIIAGFAQLINSLSFSIQIFIFSERLNISSYLVLLDKARATQTNPLLLKMMGAYRIFIQQTIKDNEVLDKKFYLIVPLYVDEIGLSHSKDLLWQKIKTVLMPRRDQIIRQLARIGLTATQLDNKKIIDLFYDIYNGEAYKEVRPPAQEEVQLKTGPTVPSALEPSPLPSASTPPAMQLKNQPNQMQPITQATPQNINPPAEPVKSRNHPFVVEEL